DRALLAGIDRLVVAPVRLVVLALGGDVGRQRDMADGGDGAVEIRAGSVEVQGDFATLAFLLDDGGQVFCSAEGDAVAALDAFSGPGESLPAVAGNTHMQRCGHLLAARALPVAD